MVALNDKIYTYNRRLSLAVICDALYKMIAKSISIHNWHNNPENNHKLISCYGFLSLDANKKMLSLYTMYSARILLLHINPDIPKANYDFEMG